MAQVNNPFILWTRNDLPYTPYVPDFSQVQEIWASENEPFGTFLAKFDASMSGRRVIDRANNVINWQRKSWPEDEKKFRAMSAHVKVTSLPTFTCMLANFKSTDTVCINIAAYE